jgi:hypothetical protein
LDVILGKYLLFNEQYTNWFMTLCNQDEDSEEQVDKTTEAPKEIGTEVKHRDVSGGFVKRLCLML